MKHDVKELKELYEYFKELGVFNKFQQVSLEGQFYLLELMKGREAFNFETEIAKYIYTQ